MTTLIAVELEPSQAEFLNICRANYATIGFMEKSGVFQLFNANAILSFDVNGRLKSIKKEIYTYAV